MRHPTFEELKVGDKFVIDSFLHNPPLPYITILNKYIDGTVQFKWSDLPGILIDTYDEKFTKGLDYVVTIEGFEV